MVRLKSWFGSIIGANCHHTSTLSDGVEVGYFYLDVGWSSCLLVGKEQVFVANKQFRRAGDKRAWQSLKQKYANNKSDLAKIKNGMKKYVAYRKRILGVNA